MDATKINPVVGAHKDTIKQISVTLLRDHGITQPTIYNWIREAFSEYTQGMKKKRILYNVCYGGYGFSKEFKMFKAKGVLCGGVFGGKFDEDIVKDHRSYREKAVDYIAPFGKAILQIDNMNVMKSVLYMYHKYNFSDIVYKINDYFEADEEDAQRLRSEVEASIGCEFFLELKDYIKSFEEVKKQTLKKQLGAQYTRLIETYRPFICELFDKGYQEPNTWIFGQNSYSATAILYLIQKYTSDAVVGEDFISMKTILESCEIWNETYEAFGLQCASGACAELAIKDVPPLLEYRIEEYDGMEDIIID